MAYMAFGKKEYFLLGKLLTQRHPDMAKELLPQLPGKAQLTDYDKVPALYLLFCKIINVNPEEYRGQLHRTAKLDIRRLFISTMLHLYVPEIFNHPLDGPIVPWGFSKKICDVLHVGKGQMSRIIREVILAERAYEEYKTKVDDVLTKMTAGPESK